MPVFVQFQVGQMKYFKGKLQKVRGSPIMLSVHPDITASDILEQAVDKHRACDCTLPRSVYKLLYPDGQPVEFVPGTVDSFTLLKYKNFIGKAYQKLVLYICTEEDYLAGIFLLNYNGCG